MVHWAVGHTLLLEGKFNEAKDAYQNAWDYLTGEQEIQELRFLLLLDEIVIADATDQPFQSARAKEAWLDHAQAMSEVSNNAEDLVTTDDGEMAKFFVPLINQCRSNETRQFIEQLYLGITEGTAPTFYIASPMNIHQDWSFASARMGELGFHECKHWWERVLKFAEKILRGAQKVADIVIPIVDAYRGKNR